MRINYKSDFDFILRLTDAQGEDMGFPSYDFRLTLGTPMGVNKFTASCIGGECVGCYNDEGHLHVVCDGHGLGCGRVSAELTAKLPNAIYPDGSRRLVGVYPTGIELVRGRGDEESAADVSVAMPVAVVTAYDLAVRQGYTGTAEEYMRATLGLVQTVDEARQTLEQSQHAAQVATEAAETVGAVMDDARAATAAAQSAAGEAGSAAESARSAAADAGLAGGYALTNAERAKAVADRAEAFAVKDASNVFEAAQTVNGTLTVNGDIVQNGEAYVSHAEHVETLDDHITLRKGAVGALSAQERAGLEIEKYDGVHDGVVELGADGTLRVGDKGDAQPLLTRAEAVDLADGALLRWDAAHQRAVALPMRTVEMVVTYEDDSTETFMVVCHGE